MNRRFLRHASLIALSSAPFLYAPAWAQAQAQAQDTAAAAPQGRTVNELVVTAKRLDEARAAIQPQIGASVYTINHDAIQAIPGGENVQLSQVILQSPGVTQDSFGQIHVREEHNGLQFRINGVILPEGLSVFSQALSPRIADKVQLITGALPAEYGLRTGGIIDVTTKSGVYQNGGEVSVYGGSHDEIEPSVQYGGSSGSINYFVSASYLHDALGIESPDASSTPLHDKTDQFQGFAYLEDIIDQNSRVTAVLGASNQRFQIPDQVGQTPGLLFGPNGDQPLTVNGQTTFPSENANQSQKEATYFGTVSYLRTSDRFTGQISLFGRYSTLRFIPDPRADILFNGISQTASKSDTAGGIQAEGSYRLGNAHTIRGGLIGEIDRSVSDTTSQVIALNPDNSQVSDQPITVVDDGGKTAYTFSAYLQDEWKLLSNLTLNYGVRFDQYDGYRNENQVSPRVNLVWLPTPSTTLHAGYSRYFSPPPFELVAQESVSRFLNTTNAPAVPQDTTPYAERANYYDVGASQVIARALTLGVDAYYKESKDLVDEGQFGAPIILTPFNYARGIQKGVEVSATYKRGPLSAYANFAAQSGTGKQFISSQFNFSPDDLAYVNTHYINLDHSATYVASGGLSYLWRGTRIGGDVLYGSGLRAGLTLPDGSTIPNGAELPSYTQVNFSVSHRFQHVAGGDLILRFDVINAFNETILIRDGSGVGVFAPQYGPRQGFFGGVTKTF